MKAIARSGDQRLQSTCTDNGQECHDQNEGIEHQMPLVDTSAKTGAEIYDHLVQQANRGKIWAKFASDQFLYIPPFRSDGIERLSYESLDQHNDRREQVIEAHPPGTTNKCRDPSNYLTAGTRTTKLMEKDRRSRRPFVSTIY